MLWIISHAFSSPCWLSNEIWNAVRRVSQRWSVAWIEKQILLSLTPRLVDLISSEVTLMSPGMEFCVWMTVPAWLHLLSNQHIKAVSFVISEKSHLEDWNESILNITENHLLTYRADYTSWRRRITLGFSGLAHTDCVMKAGSLKISPAQAFQRSKT